jgi:uncharacterized repeat protein (TIGR03803 family)
MPAKGFGRFVIRRLAFLTLILIFSIGVSAVAKEEILYSFAGENDGLQPWAGLTAGADGALYGVTFYGGAHNKGEIFRLSREADGRWTKCVPYAFRGAADGGGPYGGLVFDSAGNLYGTTSSDGLYEGGTAFKLSGKGCKWRLSVLHQFGHGSDGNFPAATMVFDRAGNLYGTTESGGRNSYGTIFELIRTTENKWAERTLHSFNGDDGSYPWARVVLDADGNLYGTTSIGGKYSFGVVFELSRNSQGNWVEHVIHSFTGASDGSEPDAGLIFDAAGNLYGATVYGGAHGKGNLFQLTPGIHGSWKEIVLHQFTGGADGSAPWDTPIFDSAGNLYGTAYEGGDNNGTVFELKRVAHGWELVSLYLFRGGRTGKCPVAPLIRDKAGNLYGTTVRGGVGKAGIVFEIPH